MEPWEGEPKGERGIQGQVSMEPEGTSYHLGSIDLKMYHRSKVLSPSSRRSGETRPKSYQCHSEDSIKSVISFSFPVGFNFPSFFSGLKNYTPQHSFSSLPSLDTVVNIYDDWCGSWKVWGRDVGGSSHWRLRWVRSWDEILETPSP